MSDNDNNQQQISGGTGRSRWSVNRLLTGFILLAILFFIVFIGYLVVDTFLALRAPATGLPGAVATQVQQITHPTPTLIADPQTIIRQVQSLSRLETASYTIEKVITAESGEGPLGFLFRDRLLLVAQGQVIAGVDLTRLGPDDIRVSGMSVFVTLPAAEVFVATLNNEATYVYDRQTALLGQQVDLETLARQEAETRILQAALEDGILDLAQRNAELTVAGLLRGLGFEEVQFIMGTPAPDQERGD
jgi:hypothetical protein